MLCSPGDHETRQQKKHITKLDKTEARDAARKRRRYMLYVPRDRDRAAEVALSGFDYVTRGKRRE